MEVTTNPAKDRLPTSADVNMAATNDRSATPRKEYRVPASSKGNPVRPSSAISIHFPLPFGLQGVPGSMTAIREYKWFFLGTAIFLALLITWIIYLRYKLSRQMLENQLDLEKFRVERQLLVQQEPAHLLPSPMNEAQEPR